LTSRAGAAASGGNVIENGARTSDFFVSATRRITGLSPSHPHHVSVREVLRGTSKGPLARTAFLLFLSAQLFLSISCFLTPALRGPPTHPTHFNEGPSLASGTATPPESAKYLRRRPVAEPLATSSTASWSHFASAPAPTARSRRSHSLTQPR